MSIFYKGPYIGKGNFTKTGIAMKIKERIDTTTQVTRIIYFTVHFLVYFTFTAQGQKYVTKTRTDANGYSYEHVTNDPTGLRLYTLQNGLKVYLVQNFDEPRIRTIVGLRSGSAYDPPENTGLAHYLEHLFFGGNDQIGTLNWKEEKHLLKEIALLFEEHKKEEDDRKKAIIYRMIDSLSFEASKFSIRREYTNIATSIGTVALNGITYPDFTAYLGLVPSTSLEKYLLLESERFKSIALRHFHTELEVVYEEFNTEQDRVFKQKYYAISKEIFKKHPYGQQQVIGSSEHLKNPSILSINDYFNKYYVPNNMGVILIGDLQFDETIKLVDYYFGKLKTKEFTRPVLPKEDPIQSVKEIEISGPDPACVYIGFRLNGAKSEDEKYITLINMLLSNGSTGLFDINLKAKQKVKNALSSVIMSNDYGVHYLDGYPNEGQTLKQVKCLMLEQIENIKEGKFDDWLLQAVVNDLKRRKTSIMGRSFGMDGEFLDAFTRNERWSNRLMFIHDLQKITKAQLMDFARKFYKENYVILYKQKGPSKNIVKVENPRITPILLNQDKSSAYAEAFKMRLTEPAKFEAIDKKNIVYTILPNNVQVSYLPNKKNDLFTCDFIFEIGRIHNKKIALAIDYLNMAGTAKLSPDAVKQELYKLGLTFSARYTADQTILHLEGLEQSLNKGLKLLYNLLCNTNPDNVIYTKLVESKLNMRQASKNSKSAILNTAMLNYALYGENSSLRDIYSETELKNMQPGELTMLIKDLVNYKHRIFYYGKNLPIALHALSTDFNSPNPVKKYPEAARFPMQNTKSEIYFVNFEQAQAEVLILSKGEKFDTRTLARSNMFNRYFEKIVNLEIREARSLAYSTFAYHQEANDTSGSDYFVMYAGTQANKTPELLKTMTEMMQIMPASESIFQQAKEDQLKRFEAERIRESGIFWTLENYKRKGIDYDFRATMYEEVKKMTLDDIKLFFNSNIGKRNFSILLMGNKKDIDMNEVAKYGEIKQLNVDYLFNYR